MGSSNENSAFGPVSTRGIAAACPAGPRAAARRRSPPAWRPGRSAPTPAVRSASPRRSAAIVGLKPTYGACSRYGMIAFASSLDQAGPLTRDVTDAALLFCDTWSGSDRYDSTSLAVPGEVVLPSARGPRGHPARGAGGAARRRGRDRPGVRASFDAALALAEKLGASVQPCTLPHAPHALSAYYIIAPGRGLGKPGAVRRRPLRPAGRWGRRSDDDVQPHPRARGSAPRSSAGSCSAPTRCRAATTTPTTGPRCEVRTRIAEDFRAAFDAFDFIVTPTAPGPAFELGAKTDDPLAMYLNDFCTVPMSLAGIPAISIPCGLSRRPAGRPPARGAGVQRERAARRRLRARAGARIRRQPGPQWKGRRRERRVEYEPVIGLEIHVQLKTRTKMFCGCELSFGDPPNVHTCPRCLGLPGTLPVVNAQAVHYGIMIGLALGCEIAPRSQFHRKNYFYPDLPKGYQISQYDVPLCSSRAPRRRPHPPGAPRGGRRQARAHGGERADPQRRSQRRRLQPRRHAARRDRHRAGPALRRRGA